MQLRFHNSLTRRSEEFRPLDPEHVRIYVCGPTVYDLAHLGNARPVVVFDVLARLLRRVFSRVTYARNITDVDDKINARARESGEPIAAITARTTADFHADMRALNALPPDIEPIATGHIPEMVTLCEKLIARGHAYAAEGHVLFSVGSFPEYGKLSGRSPEDLLAGARVDVAPYKRDAGDFVLWKPSDAETPGWESPWGRGRPGWHIECSAMSWKHLGEVFDIHGGGHDLIFPHHENEIAQSRCAHGTQSMARYWLHNGMLLVNGEKMSKSLGNFLTVRAVLNSGGRGAGEELRYLLLRTHYRADLDFSFEALKECRAELDYLYRFKALVLGAAQKQGHTKAGTRSGRAGASGSIAQDWLAPLADDLNTAQTLTNIRAAARRYLREESQGNTRIVRLGEVGDWPALLDAIDEFSEVMGVLGRHPDDWSGVSDLDDWARLKIEERRKARAAKNWAEADRIRDELKERGWLIEDGPSGSRPRRA